MPSRVECFWLEPSTQARITWRRYADSAKSKCDVPRVPYEGHPPSVWGYHDAQVAIGTCVRGVNDVGRWPTDEEKLDPRWPKKCDCGYVFDDKDHWQINVSTLYASIQRGGVLCTLFDAPIGAMWDAPWHKGHDGAFAKPDGLYLVLRTPAGDWLIDGPSSNGSKQGWQRTGTPPYVTVTPSIGFGDPMRMHGWLRNGVLEIDTP